MSGYFKETEDGDIILTFGKYKGWPFHEVADDDQDYLVWLLNEFASGKGFDEELAVEVERELKTRGVNIDEIIRA